MNFTSSSVTGGPVLICAHVTDWWSVFIPHSTSKSSWPSSLFIGTKIFAVRAEFCSIIRGSAVIPLLASTLCPRMLSQIGAGSTLHPFITTAPDEPPPGVFDALCDAQAAIDAETNRRKTSAYRRIWNPPISISPQASNPPTLRQQRWSRR